MKWYMLTLVGQDRPGIVAHVTAALYEGGCNLGEASMSRLGGNFTIMMMVQFQGSVRALHEMIATVAESLDLHLHIDVIDARLHHHVLPDVRITVHGADRTGIVAKVTGALSEVGFHILDLQSDVAGNEQQPVYIMSIEGKANQGLAAVEAALAIVRDDGIEVHADTIDTLLA